MNSASAFYSRFIAKNIKNKPFTLMSCIAHSTALRCKPHSPPSYVSLEVNCFNAGH